jgi:hypothetical protein
VRDLVQKITAFFFIFLGFMPLLFFVSFRIQQQSIRREMREKLEQENLQTLVLHESQFEWIEDHEIRVNGMMFDIRSVNQSNGIYTFSGHYDEDETLLVNQHNEGMSKNNTGNKFFSQLLKSFFNIYFVPPGMQPVFSGELNHVPDASVAKLSSVFICIITPPPQV